MQRQEGQKTYSLGSWWTGPRGTAPTPELVRREMQQQLQQRRFNRKIHDPTVELAQELVSNAPPGVLGELLSALVDGTTTAMSLSRLVETRTHSRICGVAFSAGDLVWSCEQCGKDGTCVQCHDCFVVSDHQGHDVKFHTNQGGAGTCDCGDEQAWKEAGCCARHTTVATPGDPLVALPADVREALEPVLRGVVGLLVSHAVTSARGHMPLSVNEFLRADGASVGVLAGRLCNDDLHTYDEVMAALRDCGAPDQAAALLTARVDKDGSAVVREGGAREMAPLMHRLQGEAGLLFSVVPAVVSDLDAGVAAAMAWFSDIGQHEGVRRLVVEALLLPIYSLPGSPFLEELLCPPPELFTEGSQFPSVMPYLDRADPSASPCPFADCPRVGLAVLLAASPFLPKREQEALNALVLGYQHDARFKPGFTQLLTVLYPSLSALYSRFVGTEEESIFTTSVQVYTAGSMADLLSSDGTARRLFPQRQPVFAMPMLLRCISAELRACGGGADSARMLHHPAVTKRRLWRIQKDFEYLAANEGSFAVLAGVRDPQTVQEWLSLAGLLQGCYGMYRFTRAHVEREDPAWQTAANLVLETEATASALLVRAVKAAPSPAALRDALQRCVSLTLPLVCEEFLQKSAVHPVPCTLYVLDHCVDSPCTVAAQRVSKHPNVTILLPLHRFIAKLVVAAGSVGECVSPLGPLEAAALMEQPLRSVVWAAQVGCGMWRRNGDAAASLQYNYHRAPVCKNFYDADLALLQLCSASAGPDLLLATCVDRFELKEVLEGGAPLDAGLAEYSLPLLAELLRTLIHLVVHLPLAAHSQAVTHVLRTELAQRLLAEENVSYSRLLGVRANLSDYCGVSEAQVRDAAREMSHVREGPDGPVLTLRPQLLKYFDCEHPHSPRQSLERGAEALRVSRREALDSSYAEGARPLIDPVVVPAAGSELLGRVRLVLFRPLLLTLLRRALDLGRASQLVVGRVVYLLTLQLHCLDACLVYGSEDAACFLESTLASIDGLALVDALLGVLSEGLLAADELYRQGLEWVLLSLCDRSRSVAAYLDAKGLLAQFSKSASPAKTASAAKRKESAQRRSMNKISSSAAKFATLMDASDGDEDAQAGEATEKQARTLEDGAPECVVCKEVANRPIGYIALAQPSTLLARALKSDLDAALGTAALYRVVAAAGSVLRRSPSPAAEVVGSLAQGGTVRVVGRRGPWVQAVDGAWTLVYAAGSSSSSQTQPLLFPVQELQFSQFGAARVFVSSCGHTMHMHCLETYMKSVARSSRREGDVAVNAGAGEFLCPLCKTLANTCVTHFPPHAQRRPHPDTHPDTDTPSLNNLPPVQSSYSFLLQPNGSEYPLVSYPQELDSLFRAEEGISLGMDLMPVADAATALVRSVTRLSRPAGTREESAGLEWGVLCTSAALAHTLLCHLLLTPSPPADDRARQLLRRDAKAVQLAAAMLHTTATFAPALLSSLVTILAGTHLSAVHPSLSREQLRRQASAPLPFVLPAYCSLLSTNKSSSTDRFGDRGDTSSRPLVSKPLLAHDLHALAVVALSCSHRAEPASREVARLLVLARLAQILIQPQSSGRVPTPHLTATTGTTTGPDDDDTASLLEKLRDSVCGLCGVLIAHGAPAREQLLALVNEALAAYLEFTLLLLLAAESAHESVVSAALAATEPSAGATPRDAVQRYLSILGLSLRALLDSPVALSVVSLWAEQYGQVFCLPADQTLPPTNVTIRDGEHTVSRPAATSADADAMEVVGHIHAEGEVYEEAEAEVEAVMGRTDDGEATRELTDEDILRLLDQQTDAEVPPDMLQSLIGIQRRRQQAVVSAARGWRLLGLDPMLPSVDELPPVATTSATSAAMSMHPLTGSLTGTLPLVGRNGDAGALAVVDLSHMGVTARVSAWAGLVPLPRDFADLYYCVLAVARTHPGPPVNEPAMCLLCGRVLFAGNKATSASVAAGNSPGECTLHAKGCGAGVCAYFLCNMGRVLLVSGDHAVWQPSLYLDENGEIDREMRQNKPLFLSEPRRAQLEGLFLRHEVPKEVARQRHSARAHIIRNAWY